MHPIVLLLLIAVPICVLCFVGNPVVRSIVLLAVAGFCGFGFLASFEPPGSLIWKLGYAVSGLSALIGAVWPWFTAFGPDQGD
ncbi:MAG: hypothetical protein AB8G99_10490 [Planctomycetaceae bacterium]